jgi:NAD(P)-dependent dehydrogenase (short-subunit alcohol dehydrogenase family)
MKVLDGRLALVTGAGRGLGAAIARGLAEAGATVVVADIAPGLALETAAAISAAGYRAHPLHLDVADRPGLAAAAETVAREFGHVSILVNNAGVAGYERIGDPGSAETWDRNIGVNLTGVFDTTRAFLPALKETRGTVINISSVVAFTSAFAHVGYVASKGGVRSLTQAMCRELAPFGIRVNAVAPGYIDTAMGPKDDPKTQEWLRWHCPMGRFGEPHEVAGPVVFLASPAAGFVNGVTLPVDGGYLVI